LRATTQKENPTTARSRPAASLWAGEEDWARRIMRLITAGRGSLFSATRRFRIARQSATSSSVVRQRSWSRNSTSGKETRSRTVCAQAEQETRCVSISSLVSFGASPELYASNSSGSGWLPALESASTIARRASGSVASGLLITSLASLESYFSKVSCQSLPQSLSCLRQVELDRTFGDS